MTCFQTTWEAISHGYSEDEIYESNRVPFSHVYRLTFKQYCKEHMGITIIYNEAEPRFETRGDETKKKNLKVKN